MITYNTVTCRSPTLPLPPRNCWSFWRSWWNLACTSQDRGVGRCQLHQEAVESVEKKWGEKVWSNELGLKIIRLSTFNAKKIGKDFIQPTISGRIHPSHHIIHFAKDAWLESIRKRKHVADLGRIPTKTLNLPIFSGLYMWPWIKPPNPGNQCLDL